MFLYVLGVARLEVIFVDFQFATRVFSSGRCGHISTKFRSQLSYAPHPAACVCMYVEQFTCAFVLGVWSLIGQGAVRVLSFAYS